MNFNKFLEKHNIKKTDKLIVACSGWSDSMYLVSELMGTHPKENIIIAHFNHELRMEESTRDENFVKGFCRDNSISFALWSRDIKNLAQKNKLWIEEMARIARYDFLEETLKSAGARCILTAHHLDDSIETFMFNLIRWTKLNWLTWIEEGNGIILRPLLNLSKKFIYDECVKKNLAYIEDSTNKDDTFLRNHIRINIVPEFEKINPNFHASFLWIMEYFSELKDYLNSISKNMIIDGSYFEIERFNNLREFEKKELIAYLFKIKNDWTVWLSKWNIDEVLRFIRDKWNATNKEIKKLKLFKKNWKVYF